MADTSHASTRRARRPDLGVTALVFASILWGTTGTAASFLGAEVSPVAIGASTMAIGGFLLFAFSAARATAALRNRGALPWLLLGALGVVVYPLAFYSAMDLAGVAVGNVVALGSGPVFAALLEWVWERHRLSIRGAISTAMAVTGVVALGLFGRADVGADGGNVILGVLLGLLAGLAYAVYTYSSTRVLRLGYTGRAVMGATFGCGAIGLIPVLLLSGAPLLASTQNLSIAAYLAVGPMFIAYLLFGVGLSGLRSSAVTTITLLEPVVATLLAVTIVGERLTVVGWASILLILVGVSVLATARASDPVTDPPDASAPRNALPRPE